MKNTFGVTLFATIIALAAGCNGPIDGNPPDSATNLPSAEIGGGAQSDTSKRISTDENMDNLGSRGEAVKDRDEEWERRANELSAQLGPDQRQLRESLRNGEWQSALDQAQSLEARWAASGVVKVTYPKERAEAHIGLGHAEEAVRIFQDEVQPQEHPGNLTLALALAMTDQLDAEGAKAAADACVRYSGDIESGYVPTPVTRIQKIAVVRTARAVDAEAGAQDSVVIREAKEALRLDPSQRLAAYVLAQVLTRKGESVAARPYYVLASSLPGSSGARAREQVKSIDHLIETGQIGS